MPHGIPSRDRIEPGSHIVLPAQFPPTCSTSVSDVEADKVASDLINQLNKAIITKDYSAISSLFLKAGYWRDHLCLSWDFRTLKGSENISSFLEKSRAVSLEIDRSSASRAPHIGPIDGIGVMGIMFFVNATTELGSGRGIVSLAEADGSWKIFTVFTSLVELKGHEESANHRRPIGARHGEQKGRKNWLERRNADMNFEGKNPTVIIIGIMDPINYGDFANKPQELARVDLQLLLALRCSMSIP